MLPFTSSDGILIDIDSDGDLRIARASAPHANTLFVQWGGDTGTAVRELALAERDAELKRWRSTVSPWMVVYRETRLADHFLTLDEMTGLGRLWSIEQPPVGVPGAGKDGEVHHAVAAEYFAAQPKPNPWDHAEHDELWVITAAGREVPVVRHASGWVNAVSGGRVTAEPITAGRRIWPEGDES